jgi:hypothetical protein
MLLGVAVDAGSASRKVSVVAGRVGYRSVRIPAGPCRLRVGSRSVRRFSLDTGSPKAKPDAVVRSFADQASRCDPSPQHLLLHLPAHPSRRRSRFRAPKRRAATRCTTDLVAAEVGGNHVCPESGARVRGSLIGAYSGVPGARTGSSFSSRLAVDSNACAGRPRSQRSSAAIDGPVCASAAGGLRICSS